MTARPRIAISHPTSTDLAYNRLNWPAYAEAVHCAGGEPIQLTLASTPSRVTLQAIDAIVLPGSPADVDPVRYGQLRQEGTAAADEAREHIDIQLLEHAEQSGTPLLGVCFGMQFLNVFYGGTLIQDLSPIPVNHAAGPAVAQAHSVQVVEKSLLARLAFSEICGEGTPRSNFSVNSSHHQAVGICGGGLTITARSTSDGVVEALELKASQSDPGRFLIGVQWHPERNTKESAASRSLFAELVERAGQFRARRSTAHKREDE